MNTNFIKLLEGGDLRSIGDVSSIMNRVNNQDQFDELFWCLIKSGDRVVVMRAADAIEKITRTHPQYLQNHKSALFKVLEIVKHKELKWHLAQMIPRLELTPEEMAKVFVKFSEWAMDHKESKIVRANSLECLSRITERNSKFNKAFQIIVLKIRNENIPSLTARIKKIMTHKTTDNQKL